MKALTIKQPWGTLIMRCGKDIDRAHGDSKLLPATGALIQAFAPVSFGLLVVEVLRQLVGFANHTAMRADRTFRPAFCFEKLTRFISVLKVGSNDSGGFHSSIIALWRGFVKYTIPG